MRTTQMIKAHYEAAHGWRNKQRRGGNIKQKKAQLPNRMWDEGQAYQQFFTKLS
jgi:superfamily II DNA helicase RecQ